MAEAAKTAARQLPAFRLGKKQVFLPSHVITLLKKDRLPPNEACFKVPLRFNKFDLRDYLWNLYNVEVNKVRSYVQQQQIARKRGGARYRPQPLKFMTVELARPFQWPELLTDLEPWSHKLWKQRQEEMDKQLEARTNKAKAKVPLRSQEPLTEERKMLASLAKRMLSGDVKWSNDVVLDPRWDDLLAKDKNKAAARG